MNTAVEIAQQIKAIILEYIKPELGNYLLPNGVTVPAISIESNQQYPPPNTVIKGLEVGINPAISVELDLRLSSSNVWIYRSDILLKQWDSQDNTATALEEVIPGLQTLGLIQVFPRSPPNESLQIIESVRVQLTQQFYRLNLNRRS